MLSSAPRIVKVTVTVTPVLISDPPLPNLPDVSASVRPTAAATTRLHERFNRTPQCHDCNDVAGMWRQHPDWTQPPLPRW